MVGRTIERCSPSKILSQPTTYRSTQTHSGAKDRECQSLVESSIGRREVFTYQNTRDGTHSSSSHPSNEASNNERRKVGREAAEDCADCEKGKSLQVGCSTTNQVGQSTVQGGESDIAP